MVVPILCSGTTLCCTAQCGRLLSPDCRRLVLLSYSSQKPPVAKILQSTNTGICSVQTRGLSEHGVSSFACTLRFRITKVHIQTQNSYKQEKRHREPRSK